MIVIVVCGHGGNLRDGERVAYLHDHTWAVLDEGKDHRGSVRILVDQARTGGLRANQAIAP